MAKNRVSDLTDHLFAALERLGDESLDADQVATEVSRAEAVVKVADQLVETYDMQLRAAKLYAEHGERVLGHLPAIGKAAE